MGKNPNLLLLGGSWLARRLCTVAEATAKAASSAAVSPKKTERLYQKLSALGATGGSVSKTLNEHIMEGKTITKIELARCVKELRKYRRFDHALEIMEWMEKRKMNFSYADYAIRLDLIGKTKGIAAAENYFSGLPPSAKNHNATYGALLNCYCKELISDKAITLFEEMDQKNFLYTSLPFNNLMCLYMRLGQPEKVPALVDEMKKRKVSPCSFSYNILLQSYGCLNDFESVDRVLNEITKKEEDGCSEFHLEWTTYSNLATIYLKAGHFEKAELALRKLEEKMGFRSREAYHYLISIYGGTGNLSEVNRVWKSYRSNFAVVPNLSYLVMLQALARLKDVEGVAKCFKEWETSCTSYDMRMANVAIRVFLEHDMHEEAELVFNDAVKKTTGPYFKARERFMVFYLKNHELDLALQHMKTAFAESGEHEWKPLEETVKAFFDYFCKEKDVDGAEKFCNILKHINCLGSNAYSSLLKTYIAAGKLAPEMRQRLAEDGVEISDELENLLKRVSPN